MQHAAVGMNQLVLHGLLLPPGHRGIEHQPDVVELRADLGIRVAELRQPRQQVAVGQLAIDDLPPELIGDDLGRPARPKPAAGS